MVSRSLDGESSAEPRYPYVHVNVAPSEVEEAGGFLFELGAQGIEERDASTLIRAPEGLVTLVASFDCMDEAVHALGELPQAWSPRIEEVVGDAWRDEWKKHFFPFVICPGVWIAPPWERASPNGGEIVLELEPGRAFGTGLHESTALVAQALFEHREELGQAEILDVGTGSGILGLVALALGGRRVHAIDTDSDAISVARENALRNGLDGRMVCEPGTAHHVGSTFQIVLANIEASVLISIAEDLGHRVAVGGILLLSGVLVPQATDVAKAYPAFALVRRLQRGEWVSLVLRKFR